MKFFSFVLSRAITIVIMSVIKPEVVISIPTGNEFEADVLLNAISADPESKKSGCTREMSIQNNVLITYDY